MSRSVALLFLAMIATVGTLLYVRGRFLVVELSYELDQKNAIRSKLQQKVKGLELELATLKSPRRIERTAREKLNLNHRLSSVSMVVVENESRKEK